MCDKDCDCGWKNLKFDINTKFAVVSDTNEVVDVISLEDVLVKYRLFPIIEDLLIDEEEIVPEVDTSCAAEPI